MLCVDVVFEEGFFCPRLVLCDRPLDRCCRRRRSRFVALRPWLLVLWQGVAAHGNCESFSKASTFFSFLLWIY